MGSIGCQEFEGNYDTSNYVNWIRSRVCQDKKKRRISIKLCILPLIAMCFCFFSDTIWRGRARHALADPANHCPISFKATLELQAWHFCF